MATLIPVKITRTFDLPSSPEQSYALFSNVPRSASHYPDVQNLVKIDDSTYRWEMVPVSYAGQTMQAIYVLRYGMNPAQPRSIWWEPVKQDDHFVAVEGFWELLPQAAGTRATFELTMSFDLPVPQMFASMAKQLLSAEIGKQVDTYIAGVTKTLSAV